MKYVLNEFLRFGRTQNIKFITRKNNTFETYDNKFIDDITIQLKGLNRRGIALYDVEKLDINDYRFHSSTEPMNNIIGVAVTRSAEETGLGTGPAGIITSSDAGVRGEVIMLGIHEGILNIFFGKSNVAEEALRNIGIKEYKSINKIINNSTNEPLRTWINELKRDIVKMIGQNINEQDINIDGIRNKTALNLDIFQLGYTLNNPEQVR